MNDNLLNQTHLIPTKFKTKNSLVVSQNSDDTLSFSIEQQETKTMTNEEKEIAAIKAQKILDFRARQEKIVTLLQNLIFGMVENGIATSESLYELTVAINNTVQACNVGDCLYEDEVY